MAINLIDPIAFTKLCWPEINLYDKQREIMYSVQDNDETYAPAGNALGKDFVSAIIALWFFVSRTPAKVVTTSVQGSQLNDVLWGEIRRLVDTSAVNLPIQFNHLRIRQRRKDGTLVGNAELVGQVINKGESLLGRHLARGGDNLPRTLCIFDESSGIDDQVYESATTWAHRILVIGNPYPCDNFFKKGVKGGDIPRPDGEGYYRKVIRIKGADSPNVRFAMAQKQAGKTPTGETLVPGCLSYDEYQKRRTLWDAVRQSVGLDAEFYEGAEVLLFPPDWLNRAEQVALNLQGVTRHVTHVGCDPAEGGDKTVWTGIDDYGVIFQDSQKTPDTSVIVDHTIHLMQKYQVKPENVIFDRGGGGKQHADRLRLLGYKVRMVGFGESATGENRFRFRSKRERMLDEEKRKTFKNRRAEMYWLLRLAIDPFENERGFAIPPELHELRRQLSPLPLMYDGEGTIILPPKRKQDPKSKVVTIEEMLGCSPDEADSLVLANYARVKQETRLRAG